MTSLILDNILNMLKDIVSYKIYFNLFPVNDQAINQVLGKKQEKRFRPHHQPRKKEALRSFKIPHLEIVLNWERFVQSSAIGWQFFSDQ